MDYPSLEKLFFSFYHAQTETELEKTITSGLAELSTSWKPLGENESNYGVIENQQSSPIAALIEKVTNSIDAILTKKCLEAGIDPNSPEAPRSIKEAIERFFHSKDWDVSSQRRKQALNLQVLADGPKRDTSVVIYDNGEGQRPENFERTFLSLLRGNKNEIHFVQGKYNMGGSGAIVFCGKKGYQLIASKRFDGGELGFTLVREHPLSKEEQKTKKNTWYEYLVIDGQIPSFPIKDLDLGLFKRPFQTGTIIKLYSYQFPSGYSGFAQDLNQSINEYLFEPALPLYTVEKKERYPSNKVLERDLYGLKRRLENESKYIEKLFTDTYRDEEIGEGPIKVTCYIFKNRVGGWTFKETRENIRKQFFKNNMSVLFSLNGQVHGHYTSEFITRSLKFNLLKDHLLIHVDCTEIDYEIRKELFMASRDRLKSGTETNLLRKVLAEKLKKSRLSDIIKQRKQNISVGDTEDSDKLIQSLSRNLPFDNEVLQLLGKTFNLEPSSNQKKKVSPPKSKKSHYQEKSFDPKRFPTTLKYKGVESNSGDIHAVSIPLGGEKTIKLETDVEDFYFDRTEEPGELKISFLGFNENGSSGGDGPGNKVDTPQSLIDVNEESPEKGTIKIHFKPHKDVEVGLAQKVKVSLSAPGGSLEHIFHVKIVNPSSPQKAKLKELEPVKLNLPRLVKVSESGENDETMTWEKVNEVGGELDYDKVLFPSVEGDTIEAIYINMDCKVLKNFKSKYKNPSNEQLALADRKFTTTVYFHTLFLYAITQKRKYNISKPLQEGSATPEPVDIGEYIQDIFSNHYAEFLLNFGGMEEMMEGLG